MACFEQNRKSSWNRRYQFTYTSKTWGYYAYKSGIDIALLQHFFGHSSPATTLKYIDVTRKTASFYYLFSHYPLPTASSYSFHYVNLMPAHQDGPLFSDNYIPALLASALVDTSHPISSDFVLVSPPAFFLSTFLVFNCSRKVLLGQPSVFVIMVVPNPCSYNLAACLQISSHSSLGFRPYSLRIIPLLIPLIPILLHNLCIHSCNGFI